MTVKSEITYAVDASTVLQNKLGTILHSSPDSDILMSRELLSRIYARLGNDAHVLRKCFDNVIEP